MSIQHEEVEDKATGINEEVAMPMALAKAGLPSAGPARPSVGVASERGKLARLRLYSRWLRMPNLGPNSLKREGERNTEEDRRLLGNIFLLKKNSDEIRTL